MQTLKQEYRSFLKESFEELRLRTPLFYSSKFGLRFDLQKGKTDTDEYFNEVLRRSSSLFETAFNKTDKVLLILIDYKYKRNKIRFSNYTFKQINNLKKEEVCYFKESNLYETNDKYNVAIIKLNTSRINYKNILKAIANTDFPSREPTLDNKGFFSSKEIYFLNLDKNLIFHMYDDRGLDIISSDNTLLSEIFKKHNDLILEYDRKEIEKQFK